jgi:hypothetical protein
MSIADVLFHSAVNALVTWILVESFLFKGLQKRIKLWGCNRAQLRLDADRSGGIGEKLAYLASCPLCLGVWVGFLQAQLFAGPFAAKYVIITIVYNGLLFKSFGHVFYQLLAALHNINQWLSRKAEAASVADHVPAPKPEVHRLTVLSQDLG